MGKPQYINVGPVNRVRTKAVIAVLEDAIGRNSDGRSDDSRELLERVIAAVRSVEPDMPELRFGSAGLSLGLCGAAFYIEHDWGSASLDFMKDTVKALRKALDRIPGDAAAPRVILTVGQLRDVLEGLDRSVPVDFQVFTSLDLGGRFRAGSVERWGVKGSDFQGVTVKEWISGKAPGNEGEKE